MSKSPYNADQKCECALNKKTFTAICSHFPRKLAANLFLVDSSGKTVCAIVEYIKIPQNILLNSSRESMRWGECNVLELEGEAGAIVAPIIINSHLLGSLVWFSEKLFCLSEEFSSAFILEISQKLIDALHAENLTNKYLLQTNHNAMLEARISAEILHEKKDMPLKLLRDVYIFREDALISAIKRGQRNQARKILNDILIYLYGQCASKLDLIKTHLIEMSVMMIRGSIELGFSEIGAFENSYKMLSELSAAKDEETMSVLATRLLEEVMDNIESTNSSMSERKFRAAFTFLKANFAKPELSRQDLARYCRLSEKQLSRLFKKFTDKSFCENLSELRISRACQMMLSTTLTSTEISYEVGFSDQSYFSKIFKKYTKFSPSDFRTRIHSTRAKSPKNT